MKIAATPIKKELGLDREHAQNGASGLGALRPYLATLVAVAATLALVGIITHYVALPTALLLYLVPVTVAATRWGRGPALVGVTVAVLAHDLLFVEPVGRLTIARADEAIGLALLVFVALVTAELADAAHRGAEREQEATIARRSDELKTALLHAVSHNFRTPLASIKAAASGLRERDAPYSAEDRAELLATIEEEADSLDRLVRNLLDASRVEAGALVMRSEPQDLGELVRTAVDRSRSVLAERPVAVTIAENLPLVACDYAQIDQVLVNLLENAARHTPPGSPVSVDVSQVANSVQVAVSDHGRGIAPSERERVFRPFERGRTRASGSGLGLAIARGLIDAHGGRLWIDDAVGAGARFVFSLPVHKVRE